jgi:hypothetical protein
LRKRDGGLRRRRFEVGGERPEAEQKVQVEVKAKQ